LLRFWFVGDEHVNRRTYLEHGVALALVKYTVDAALIWAFANVLWTPIDYVFAGLSLERSKLSDSPLALSTVLALWTAPFFWIGLSLTARRARDAGISPWFAQLFFVPVVGYVFIAIVSLAPSRMKTPALVVPGRSETSESEFRIRLRAIGLGVLAGLAMVLLGVRGGTYGASIFFGAPFVVGAVIAYVYNRSQLVTGDETRRVVLFTLLFIALATIAFAIEGIGCIVMVFPLAYLIATMGSWFGRWMALNDTGTVRGAVVGLLLLPATAPIMDSHNASRRYEVRSAIEIDAPPEAVWRNVVTFPRIAPATDLLSRTGIAYPIGARIVGEGVGAVRYCDFSTGSFVEPITHWEPGVRLAFQVTSHPPPMREWSPYQISPPHLDGYFAATRGEFRLIALPDGRTRLEGSTWYELRMAPEAYWALFATAIVERIHLRVLRHIKAVTEN
jgi:uncharacterized membrane protein YhaH (DUF805 family)